VTQKIAKRRALEAIEQIVVGQRDEVNLDLLRGAKSLPRRRDAAGAAPDVLTRR
jgi:hypothetical protein